MAIRILCTGDIHLGRHPAQISERPDRQSLGPAAAWQSFVHAALDGAVDIVALTGDIVDESNKFYEAFSVLYSGVQRLVEAGITVLAVSGNHDFDVLPRLADQLPGFRLLGRGGAWEEYVHEAGGAAVRFQGWSFAARHVNADPLGGYCAPADDLPTIGLLHCDCDAPGSPYAPVTLAALKGTGVTAWMLGHVHMPQVLCTQEPAVLYPGSLQGLDPGEPGGHAAVLLTVGGGAAGMAVERVPLAALRWEQLEVAMEGAESEDDLQRALTDALRGCHARLEQEAEQARLVGCRLRLSGRTALHRALPALLPSIISDFRPVLGEVEYFVETVQDRTRPSVSLEELSRADDPAGLLARRLLLLERREPEDQYRELAERGRRAIEEARGQAQFAAVAETLPAEVGAAGGEAPPDPDAPVRELLLRAGLRALDELLAQKEASR